MKEVYKKNKGKLLDEHHISHSILWLCDRQNWMKNNDLSSYWGKQLKLNESDPDVVVPTLLTKSDTYNGNPIRKEVFTLLVAYKFRNYGAHNIRQQKTVVTNYEDIIKNLLYSLFLSVENL